MLGQKLKASLHTCRMSHSGATPAALLQIPDWYSSKLRLFTQLLSGKFKIIQGSRGWEWIVFGPLPVHHSFRPACLPIPNCLDLHSVSFAAVFAQKKLIWYTFLEHLLQLFNLGQMFLHIIKRMHLRQTNPFQKAVGSLLLLDSLWALTRPSPTSAVKPEASSS